MNRQAQSVGIDLLCLAFLLFIFYLLYLGSYPLFTPDEGRYSEVAREMIASGDYITPRVDGVAFLDKPILYYWLQAAAIRLFGLSEWTLRFFPAFVGILGCLMTYLCGRHLFNRQTGLIAALVLATTPLYFGAAHYANLDLEVAVFVSCSLLCFITAVNNHLKVNTGFMIAAYFFASLAFLTKGMIGLVFPSLIAGTWMLLTKRWMLLKSMHLIKGILLFIVLVLPWYVLVQKANPEFLHYFFVTQQVTRFLSQAEFNNQTPLWFYAPIVLIGAFPWTIFFLQALGQALGRVWFARLQYQAELFLLLWFTVIFVFFSIPHSKTAGYILPVFPALALLVGRYLAAALKDIRTKSLQFNLASFIVFSGLFTTLLCLLAYYNFANLSPYFMPHLIIIAITFIIGMIAAAFFYNKNSLLPLFSICLLSSVIMLLTIIQGAQHLNQNTAKPLVSYLKTIIKPEDEVINYYKFYQDIPLYLERRVTIVTDWQSPAIPYRDNWVRELWYGMAFQKTDEWLINEKTFWQRWNSQKRVFVFVNENYFAQFKSHTAHYFPLARYNDILLLSNFASS